MLSVYFRKKFRFFSFDFRQNFEVQTFSRWLSIRRTKFFGEISQKCCFQKVHFCPIRWVPKRFFKILVFIVKICILIWDFWVIFENYSMRMLSIRGNDSIAYLTYEEWNFVHAQPVVKCKQFLDVNPCWAYAERISSHTEPTRNEFHR